MQLITGKCALRKFIIVQRKIPISKLSFIKLKTVMLMFDVSTKKFSPIGPAVWPAIGNIYMTVLFYL